ncbi:hypothetical protein, partial [Streptomyces sp. NPDC001274]
MCRSARPDATDFPVVILDEATAHLDNTSEAAVQEALTEALAGRTAVVTRELLEQAAFALLDYIETYTDGFR